MLVPDLDLVLVSTSAADAAGNANNHANNVFGMLQRVIRAFDRHANRYRMSHAVNASPGTQFR
jgi:hypothetical protein